MTRRLSIYMLLAFFGLVTVLSGCNSKSEDEPEVVELTYSNVAVNSFSLSRNEKVLTRLDSVYFAIDLDKAVVFNADSLPVGTDVSHLVLNIGLPKLSAATIIEAPGADGKSREFDYLKSSKDSIDFTRGDVKLRLVSYDEKATRDYIIKVNVHRMEPDSLYWNKPAVRELPGNVSNPTAQKAVRFGDRAACMVTDGTSTRISFADNPSDQWESYDCELPAGADVATLTAVGDKLYLLASGTLYESTDGVAWTSCGENFHWIYGGYQSSILASRRNATGGWEIVRYPEMTVTAAPADMPVDGTSSMLAFETEWASSPTSIMIGGCKADGSLSAQTWGFDGTEWAPISINGLPEGLKDMTLLTYFSFITNQKRWLTTKYTTLVALGGRDETGNVCKTVYISFDNGIRWKKADDLMQLPDYMPAMSSAQALVFPSMISSRSCGAAWHEMPALSLPVWWMIDSAEGFSRAVAPITEWECPYIYLFGGTDARGALYNTVWRGVINRLTFKPLQ